MQQTTRNGCDKEGKSYIQETWQKIQRGTLLIYDQFDNVSNT